MNNISYNDTLYSSFKVIGTKVLIKKLIKNDLRQVNGIYIPDSEKNKNQKIGVGQILEAGEEAKKDYGITPGTYVAYDYYSSFGDYKDAIITNAENLIFELSEEEVYKFLESDL